MYTLAILVSIVPVTQDNFPPYSAPKISPDGGGGIVQSPDTRKNSPSGQAGARVKASCFISPMNRSVELGHTAPQ